MAQEAKQTYSSIQYQGKTVVHGKPEYEMTLQKMWLASSLCKFNNEMNNQIMFTFSNELSTEEQKVQQIHDLVVPPVNQFLAFMEKIIEANKK